MKARKDEKDKNDKRDKNDKAPVLCRFRPLCRFRLFRPCALVLSVCLLLTSCYSAPLMQDCTFQAVAVGARISEVEAVYGEPYSVRNLPNGNQEYLYIQRIDCGSSSVEVTEYAFTVCQGKIVGKNRREQSSGSGIGFCQ